MYYFNSHKTVYVFLGKSGTNFSRKALFKITQPKLIEYFPCIYYYNHHSIWYLFGWHSMDIQELQSLKMEDQSSIGDVNTLNSAKVIT